MQGPHMRRPPDVQALSVCADRGPRCPTLRGPCIGPGPQAVREQAACCPSGPGLSRSASLHPDATARDGHYSLPLSHCEDLTQEPLWAPGSALWRSPWL